MTAQTEIFMTVNFAGQANAIVPRDVRLYCPNNTLSEMATAGFIDNYLSAKTVTLLPTDFVLAVGSNGHQIYKPVFTNGSCQLTVLP